MFSDIFLKIFPYFIKKTWAARKDSAEKELNTVSGSLFHACNSEQR
jgi:hypothetical protein